jgi:hypothetical protein
MERRCRLHLTNVSGLGASRLVASLLNAVTRQSRYSIEGIYLPEKGPLASFETFRPEILIERYRRVLPNSISRLVECTIGSSHFDGDTPLLVLGDLPLRVRCRQSVFVQQRFLLDDDVSSGPLFSLKVNVLQRVFAMNVHFASTLIVQSELMKAALVERYGVDAVKVRVIPQPAPAQVIEAGLRRTGKVTDDGKVALFYPAATLPHKNHRLLSSVSGPGSTKWRVSRLTLTVPPEKNPNPSIPWIDCVGELAGAEVIDEYASADALLFLSTKESFGVPLVEAMVVGLPIVCADVPYARNLCGDTAIYFAPNDIRSLQAAVAELNSRLDAGWWPDWSHDLQRLPKDWNVVAEAMLATLFD